MSGCGVMGGGAERKWKGVRASESQRSTKNSSHLAFTLLEVNTRPAEVEAARLADSIQRRSFLGRCATLADELNEPTAPAFVPRSDTIGRRSRHTTAEPPTPLTGLGSRCVKLATPSPSTCVSLIERTSHHNQSFTFRPHRMESKRGNSCHSQTTPPPSQHRILCLVRQHTQACSGTGNHRHA